MDSLVTLCVFFYFCWDQFSNYEKDSLVSMCIFAQLNSDLELQFTNWGADGAQDGAENEVVWSLGQGDQASSSQKPPGSQPVCSELILVYCFIATLMKCIKRNARSPSNAEMQGPVECFFLVFTTEAELNAAFAGNYLAVPRRRSENKIPRNGNNCLNVIQFYFYSFYDKV